MIEMNNMNLHLNHKHVLKDISLKIPISGEIIGIMGPNGAGKSSLLKCLIGEFNATGEMYLYGKFIHKQLQYITYIPQKAQLDLDFPINVEKVILSGCYQTIGWFKRVDHASKVKFQILLKDLDLESLQFKQISELSGGQLQRVLVARALMSDSSVYLLDEPFVGIDFNSEQLIMDKLRQLKIQGKLILIVHHDLSKAEHYFDRILLLNRTVRFFGPSHQAMQSQYLNRTFLFNVTSTFDERSGLPND
ncbi:metal ABC transporter ATP-binding protein [Staphylococcus sp. NRL 21/187]|nr:metal ABC transporter ATP-binding protein [Staphylococcus sp. NRL 21/187]MCJ1655243.1 metal ABC transporter ATP-binding protein [Staphylococcus sp. NRL 21/187]